MAIDSRAQGQTTDQVRAFAFDGNGQILEARTGRAAISPPPPPSSGGGGGGGGGGGTTLIRVEAVQAQATTQAATFTPTGTYSTQHYAYVDGQQIGEVDEGGDIDVLNGVTGFSDSTTGTRNYVVQAGDTLAGIAQQVYGDASLWYVVADANGLQTDSDLVTGQTLKLPQVTTSSNTAETFKPYDPNAIQGSTTPSLPHAPMPPPSAGHGCNALAEIVVIAVAVVVSVVTYGALAPEMEGLAGSVIAGAAAGAAASAASQLTGDALGVSHGFDWGQVLVGAAGGAIGALLHRNWEAPRRSTRGRRWRRMALTLQAMPSWGLPTMPAPMRPTNWRASPRISVGRGWWPRQRDRWQGASSGPPRRNARRA